MADEKQVQTELTLIQKIALESEVSYCFDTAIHEADEKFFTYVLLMQYSADKDYLPFVKKELEKYTDIDEIEKINMYVVNDIFPKTLWINKFIEDVKAFIGVTECKERVPKLSKSVLKSKFTSYLRITGVVLPSIVRDLAHAIIEEETGTLDFLNDICNYFLLTLEGKVDVVNDTLKMLKMLQPTVAELRPLSFAQEMDALTEKDKEITPESILDIVESVINKKSTNKTYCVNKIDKATKNVVFTKEFASRTKALEYLKRIGTDYPELRERYDFVIVEQQTD